MKPAARLSGGQTCIGDLCGFPFDDGRGRAEGLGLEVWLFYHLEHEAGGLPAHLVHIHLDGSQRGLEGNRCKVG